MARPTTKTKLHYQVYNYLDYHHYLKDLVKELKVKHPGFTMRTFAEAAGFGSPSYLKMVIDGQRKLTEASIEKFSIALDISGREKEYFVTLVRYNQCVDPDEKKILFETLNDLRPRKTLTSLEKHQIKFLTHDYYSCIREMVLLDDFQEDAKWIAARCVPRISPTEAREAIETLLTLKLLTREADERLRQSEDVVGTQAETEVVEAFNFHDAVLTKARNALSRTRQEDRHYEALTIPMNPELAKTINQKIAKVLEEVLDEVNTGGQKYEEVYQLSVQFFPATTREHVAIKDHQNKEQGHPHENGQTHNSPSQNN
jgi:uncharacterized protein (TIGR02147 family)